MGTTLKNDISPKNIDEQMYSEVVTAPSVASANPGHTIENAAHFRYHYWQVDVAGLSTAVVVRPEGSIESTGAFATLAADGEDITIEADGSFWITTTRGVRASRVRLEIVSGAATTISVKYRGGN